MPQLPAHNPRDLLPDKERKHLEKLDGFVFAGVTCSATRADQDGLTAVFIGLSQGFITSTVFEFQNGSTLALDANNYLGFASAFSAFRNSFYAS